MDKYSFFSCYDCDDMPLITLAVKFALYCLCEPPRGDRRISELAAVEQASNYYDAPQSWLIRIWGGDARDLLLGARL